jgi:hypothetical protein
LCPRAGENFENFVTAENFETFVAENLESFELASGKICEIFAAEIFVPVPRKIEGFVAVQRKSFSFLYPRRGKFWGVFFAAHENFGFRSGKFFRLLCPLSGKFEIFGQVM